MVTSVERLRSMPDISFGERFRIRSARGSPYVARLIHSGEGESGLYVRLDDRRIARLDHGRIVWSTFARASDDGERILQPGDEIVVESASGTLRGQLTEPVGADIAVRTSRGVVRVTRNTVLAVQLLFQARELRPGDRFIVRSRSGNEYQGAVNSVEGERLGVQLRNGREVTLHLDRLDMNTLVVPIPLPLDRL